MNISAPFIRRPVGTTLLLIALVLAGAVAYRVLPVSPLPQVDFPTISVSAQLPGASAEIMAATVATPLERQLGRIAGLTEMTSASSLGSTVITLQFDLERNIDGAARDVQAAIQAAQALLPTNLPNDPQYRKVNPADAPILVLALTSSTFSTPQLYDFASTVMAQRISQIEGVGQVTVGGSSSPAVRVEVDPLKLATYGLAMTDLRAVIQRQNSNLARGQVEHGPVLADILTNGQIEHADDYRQLAIAFLGGRMLQLGDVAEVIESQQNIRTAGYTDGKPSIALIIFRAPGANIILTVDRVLDALPQLQASIPSDVDMTIVLDRTQTIRASVHDVEITLVVSIVLVVLVVFAFLLDVRATFIPAVAVPASLIGTVAVMYLFGYSIDNLSLMAITVATGFVIDDAIVVMEDITRHLEQGEPPLQAALLGSREIGFTVVSISLSLIVVFTPIRAMGGIVGRLLREFGMTLSIAIVISMLLSLTVTPMMCARILRPRGKPTGLRAAGDRLFERVLARYRTTLVWALRHRALVLLALLATFVLNVVLVLHVPKGFFPQQDTGVVFGALRGPQDASFETMDRSTKAIVDVISRDPAVAHVAAFTGVGATNTGNIFLALKPLDERGVSAGEVIGRLRGPLAKLPVASVYLQPSQDVRVGGRMGFAQYQYTLQADSLEELTTWGPRLLAGMQQLPGLLDVSSDQQNGGLQSYLSVDRAAAARVGLTIEEIDSNLASAFGQSLASVIYGERNQYYVVLEAAPRFTQRPADLDKVYFQSNGQPTPLSSFASWKLGTTPLQVSHTGLFPSVTVSFNLAPGIAVGDATERIDAMQAQLGMPTTIRGAFSGTLEAFKESLASEPLLVLTALLAVYLVLGILYESLIHPLTILSTLPSASVGAMLALLVFGAELDVVAVIGIVLLIGIVKKNAIMMIDFALAAERDRGMSPYAAIFDACMLRFRPIMMTTLAALFGALPMVFGTGLGAELRRPLGITIVGGLIVSQLLTLYTTPVIYLYLDRFRRRKR